MNTAIHTVPRTPSKARLPFRKAYDRYMVAARDRAAFFVGDPQAADVIARKAIVAFCAAKEQPRADNEIRRAIDAAVERICLESSGCRDLYE